MLTAAETDFQGEFPEIRDVRLELSGAVAIFPIHFRPCWEESLNRGLYTLFFFFNDLYFELMCLDNQSGHHVLTPSLGLRGKTGDRKL